MFELKEYAFITLLSKSYVDKIVATMVNKGYTVELSCGNITTSDHSTVLALTLSQGKKVYLDLEEILTTYKINYLSLVVYTGSEFKWNSGKIWPHKHKPKSPKKPNLNGLKLVENNTSDKDLI